jgi:hypothetical protein
MNSRLLSIYKFHHRVHNSPALYQTNPVRAFISCLRSILKLTFHPCLGLASRLFPSGFSVHTVYAFVTSATAVLLCTPEARVPTPYTVCKHTSRPYSRIAQQMATGIMLHSNVAGSETGARCNKGDASRRGTGRVICINSGIMLLTAAMPFGRSHAVHCAPWQNTHKWQFNISGVCNSADCMRGTKRTNANFLVLADDIPTSKA